MAEAQDEVQVDIDLYDSDVLKIEAVIKALNHTRAHKSTTVEGWRNEVTQRFAEAGFRVNVVLQQIDEIQVEGKATQKDGRIFTSITIVGRTEDIKVGEYDHERQRDEVRRNIQGRNAQGNVKAPTVAVSGGTGGSKRSHSGLILPN